MTMQLPVWIVTPRACARVVRTQPATDRRRCLLHRYYEPLRHPPSARRILRRWRSRSTTGAGFPRYPSILDDMPPAGSILFHEGSILGPIGVIDVSPGYRTLPTRATATCENAARSDDPSYPLRRALPADHDGHDGRALRHAPDRARLRGGRGGAASARPGRRRRASRLAVPDAVRHAGDLHVHGSAVGVPRPEPVVPWGAGTGSRPRSESRGPIQSRGVRSGGASTGPVAVPFRPPGASLARGARAPAPS